MALSLIGDGEYISHGNVNETIMVGRSTQRVQIAEATGSAGFYGKTPLVQRPYSAAVHNTTALAASASFGATQLAAIQEIQLTLIGLGIWATV